MLRMGRTPKPEPRENESPTAARQSSVVNTPPQVVQQTPHASPQQQTRAEHERVSSTPRAISETEALARELKEGVMSGFLGSGTVLTGEAEFKGMLRIDGRFSGHISSDKGTLIVSAGGRVDADIRVGTAKVNGVVHGDIVASERIEMGRSAQVRGNVQSPVLVVEQGAIFEGGCRMSQARPEVVKTEKFAEKTPTPRTPTTTAGARAVATQTHTADASTFTVPRTEPHVPAAEVSKAAG